MGRIILSVGALLLLANTLNAGTTTQAPTTTATADTTSSSDQTSGASPFRFSRVCEMRDFQDTEGQDYAMYSEVAGADLAECKKNCFQDDQCKAVEYKSSKCYYYRSNKGSDKQTAILSKKLCYSESELNRNCQMRDLTGNKGQDYANYYRESGNSFENCKTNCFNDPQCRATEFKSNNCYYYGTNMATVSASSTLSQKTCEGQFFSDQHNYQYQQEQNQNQYQMMGQSCQMKDFENFQGDQYAEYTTSSGTSFDDCKQQCFKDSRCHSTEFKSNICHFYRTNSGSSQSGSKLSKKFCGYNQNRQQEFSFNQNCQMKDFVNNKGEEYALYKTDSGLTGFDDCKKRCFSDRMCKSTEFYNSNCMYYTTSTGSSQTSRKLSKKLCDPCNQPRYMGNKQCNSQYQRYFYNYETRRCQMFYYGGCGGTDNNFVFMDECQNTCEHNSNNDNFQDQCEMKDTNDMQGQDYAVYNTEAGPNYAECKKRCFQDSRCGSVEYFSSNCNYYTTNQGKYSSGRKLARKVCGQERRDANDQNQWSRQRSSDEVCKMQDAGNYKGEEYAIYDERPGFNIGDCKRMCWQDPFCKATEFRSNCVFFNTMHKTASGSNTLSQKICEPNRNKQNKYYQRRYEWCQMKDKRDTRGQDYASYNQAAGSGMEDCKARCFNDYECHATEFRQSQCWFFKTRQGSSHSGSMLSQKFCQDDEQDNYRPSEYYRWQWQWQQGNRQSEYPMQWQDNNRWCQMKDKQDSKGEDYASYAQESGSNLDDCKSRCFQDYKCSSTEYRNNQCWFFNTMQFSTNSGSTLSQKFCQDPYKNQNNQQRYNRNCNMHDKSNTKGQDYANYEKRSGSSFDDCKSKCFMDFECQATEYRNNQCWFYKTNQGTQHTGSTLSQKWCNDDQFQPEGNDQYRNQYGSQYGNQYGNNYRSQYRNQNRNQRRCQMDDRQNTKGQDYSNYDQRTGSSYEDCKQKCFNDYECQGVEYRNGKCWFFKSRQGQSNSGSKFSQKNCEGHQQFGQTSQSNHFSKCEMKDKQNSKGQDYASYGKQQASSFQECKMKCFSDYQCQATEFRSRECWFFKNSQSQSNSGSTLSQKYCHDHMSHNQNQNQRADEWCQMKDNQNSKGQDYASYGVEIASNFDECKTHCFKDFECKATEYRNGNCWFFRTGQEEYRSGSTLAQKWCNRRDEGQQWNWNQQQQQWFWNQQQKSWNMECQMDDELNSRGQDYAIYREEKAQNFKQCKQWCFNDWECRATEYRTDTCFFFKSSQVQQYSGSTVSRKNCWNKNQYNNMNNNNNNQMSNQKMSNQMCEMRDRVNMKGQDYSEYRNEQGSHFEDCKAKCFKDNQCWSVEFRSGNCYFFKVFDGQQNTGSILAQKFCWDPEYQQRNDWNNQYYMQGQGFGQGQRYNNGKGFNQNRWCQMKDEQGVQGQDYAVYRTESGQTFEDCRSKCFRENYCKATEFRNNQCLFFSNFMGTQNSGATLSRKYCDQDQERQQMMFNSNNYVCRMKDVMNAEGQSYAVYNTVPKTDFEECKRMCYSDDACRATELRSGSCYFFSSNTESSRTGSTLSQKWCGEERQNNNMMMYNQYNNMYNKCQMKDSFGSKGQDYAAYRTEKGQNLDECKRKCFNDRECQSTELRAGSCIFFRNNQETKFTGAILSRKVCNQEQQNREWRNMKINRNCQMKEFMDTQGLDYAAYSTYSAQNAEECRRNCFSDMECKATEFRGSFCYMFATNKGMKKSGATLFKKFCSGDYSNYDNQGRDSWRWGNNQQQWGWGSDYQNRRQQYWNCHMQDFTNTRGEEYSMYFGAGKDFMDCKSKCFDDYDCKATEYRDAKCYYFKSGKGTFFTGSTLARKMCEEKPESMMNRQYGDSMFYCTMKDFRDNQGEEYAMYNFRASQNMENCRKQCFEDKKCKATDFKNNNCYFYSTNRATYSQGGMLSKKFCSQDQEGNYYNSQERMCRMKDFRDTQGQDYSSYNKFSAQEFDECRKKCYADKQCQATEYRNGMCWFFRAKAGTQKQGSTLAKKFCSEDQYDVHNSMNKYMCQMTDAQNTKGNDYASYDIQSATSLEECRKRCFYDNHCKATEYRSNNCYMFSNNFGVSSQGFVLSRKFCYRDPASSSASFDKMFDMFSGPRNTEQGRSTLAKMWMMKQMLGSFFGNRGDQYCQFREFQNYKGQSYYKYSQDNYENCKRKCRMDNMCQAFDVRGYFCYLYSNQQYAYQMGSRYSQKYCPNQGSQYGSGSWGDMDYDSFGFGGGMGSGMGSQQQRTTCRMNEVQNAKGDDRYQYGQPTAAGSLDDCRTNCVSDPQCKATEYRSGQCYFFNQDVVQPSQNSKVARKYCSVSPSNQFGNRFNNMNWMNNQRFNNMQGQPGFNNMQFMQGMNNMQPGMNNMQPGMNNQQPGMNNQQPGMTNQQPGMANQQPGMNNQQPGMNNQQPGMNNQQPGMNNQQPGMNNQPYPQGGPNQGNFFNQPGQPGMMNNRFNQPGMNGMNMMNQMGMNNPMGMNNQMGMNNMNMQPGMNNFNNQNQFSNNQQSGNQAGQFCEMKDVTNAMGQRSTLFQPLIPASNFNECKTACFNNPRCKAVELINGQCNLYESNAMSPSNGSEVSRKVCRNV